MVVLAGSSATLERRKTMRHAIVAIAMCAATLTFASWAQAKKLPTETVYTDTGYPMQCFPYAIGGSVRWFCIEVDE